MDDLQPAAQRSSVLKLNHELERIADFYKQAAFTPDTGFAHIQNLARRREAPPVVGGQPDLPRRVTLSACTP